MKCASCGYHKNAPEQATCNLCGAVLDGQPMAPAALPPSDVRFGDGLGTRVDDGAEVTILPAVAGG